MHTTGSKSPEFLHCKEFSRTLDLTPAVYFEHFSSLLCLVNYRNSVFSWESVLINMLLQQVREVSERETVRLFGVKEIDDEEGKVESPAFY